MWRSTLLKAVWNGYLVLTSLYCLLAYLPYTYYALIKAPPYPWIVWFVQHQAVLYWLALGAAALGYWPSKKTFGYVSLLAMSACLGVYVIVRPFLSTLQNGRAAYGWSLVALMLAVLTAVFDLSPYLREGFDVGDAHSLLPYSRAVLAGTLVALIFAAGSQVQTRVDFGSWNLGWRSLELTAWSVVSHIAVGVLLATLVNSVRIISGKTRRPRLLGLLLFTLLVFGALSFALLRFLESAMSFQGWPASIYAGSLAATLTVLGLALLAPVRTSSSASAGGARRRRVIVVGLAASLAVVALVLPSAIGDGDWNGFLQTSFALVFWTVASVCVFSVRPRPGRHSGLTMVAVVLVTAFVYKGLQATAIFWAKPLGTADDEIARKIDSYASQDASFNLTHHLLGEAPAAHCGELCRILREYTNIRDARAKDLNLVESLVPVRGERPNIFIFVIDSMRPDYLGVYNPRVDFTPNLDVFSRESIALRNVYTQYAGTTLSEPTIWTGAMLLHAHYLQPFSKVNSLEKMAKTDGYQIVVSYDTVLPNLLSPSDDLIKLDTDKLWNGYEVCSTIEQTEKVLDNRADKTRPVLFYAQPMNVHQFAKNNLPPLRAANWHSRPGFDNRIAYEVNQVDRCLGGFIGYLKSTGLYDKSIIVVTADHGDATGEFGRRSHSLWIYPEIMRVPLIIHLPTQMIGKFVHDDQRVSALTDVAPSLYYLLGHRPIVANPLFGRPLFTETMEELQSYHRDELFLASDARAVYGILADNGRYFYATYDSPAKSFLFDLKNDPNAQRDILTDPVKRQYDQRIIGTLQEIADYYGYKPAVGSWLAAGEEEHVPRGYIRVRTSDGVMHDIPAKELEVARQHDARLTVVSQ